MDGEETLKTPPWSDVIEHIEATKEYWAQWNIWELHEVVLYRKWIDEDDMCGGCS